MECQKNFTGKKDKTVSTETAWTELGEKEMENSMSKSKYVVILILCEILNMILFYYFIPKYKFNMGKINIPSCLLFGALVAGALVSGLLMTIKEERNLKSINSRIQCPINTSRCLRRKAGKRLITRYCKTAWLF